MVDISIRRKQQLAEYLAWAGQAPDATGECDGCYQSHTGLYQLPQELDTEPDAGFMYCRQCFMKIVKRKIN